MSWLARPLWRCSKGFHTWVHHGDGSKHCEVVGCWLNTHPVPPLFDDTEAEAQWARDAAYDLFDENRASWEALGLPCESERDARRGEPEG